MTEPAIHAGDRIGIDLGGTKIEGVLLAATGEELARHRMATPRSADPALAYRDTLTAIAGVIEILESGRSCRASVGVGMPGSLSPRTGLVQNANSTWLNGRPFATDLARYLGRPIRLANDANCFAISEATDGAGAGARSVFGVILGTGCGAGIVIDGRLLDGPRGIGGEWGHNPLPWPTLDEVRGPRCWCGRDGCMETWVSGPALSADFERATGHQLKVEEIVTAAQQGNEAAPACLDRHVDRLARGLSHVVNILDPDVIILGGGLSALDHLYRELPPRMAPYVFADDREVIIRPPRWGDASGVRGAAWLWD